MANSNAIPKGYMTVGELAKKAGITVRTLQFYDREGLLSPTARSEGGRRLYTDKDMVTLHQILSLKYLGFSLDDIKNRLSALDTPDDVAAALTELADSIREKTAVLCETLQAVEALKSEVLQMQTVDFKKYADIIVNLQMKNDMYWAIKLFDEETLSEFRRRFDKESGSAFLSVFQRLNRTALQYQKDKLAPESPEGQALAKEFWDMLMEFTGGDFNMLNRLMAETQKIEGQDEQWTETQAVANAFFEPALSAYFDSMGYDPFGEGKK